MISNRIATIIIFLSIGRIAFAQSESNYSFIVAGHTYGAHERVTLGLHPPFMENISTAIDSTVFALFLTGDLVNQSTKASWEQVKTDLTSIAIPSYYIMGNHDINSFGYAAFSEKHGGTFYSFYHQTDLFVVLNSTKNDRSISSDQVEFIKEVLTTASIETKRVFIFIHELIWNSDFKYKGVMCNNRSRYNQMVSYSNFWNEIFPIFSADQNRKYYLMAGDVGGNTDAVSAFYDTRDNVTFLASGMGEVADENYLKVYVSSDTVQFTLIPLNDTIIMKPVQFYTIPEKPDTVFGLVEIVPGSSGITYQTDEIFNATSYRWDLPEKSSGVSTGSSIQVNYNDNFQLDTIAVYAVNNGFGESEPFKLGVKAEGYNSIRLNKQNLPLNMIVSTPIKDMAKIQFISLKEQSVTLSIYDFHGKKLHFEKMILPEGLTERHLNFSTDQSGMLLFSLSNGFFHQIQKVSMR